MAMMTGGDALALTLRQHGVETVFGLPGTQIYGLFDAFHRYGFHVITPRHEQTCGYMALGYAKASGRPGVAAVVPGPGVLNASAALLTAAGGNAPVLCLTGQVPTAFLGKGRGHLHEMHDQRATLAGIVKAALRADAPAAAPAVLARAFQEMTSLRPGPATVEMPWDQFVARAECTPQAPLPALADPDPGDALAEAAEVMARAQAPMIFVGSGALEAPEEVRELAERLTAPVVAFRAGRGVVSNRHPLGLTIAEARHLWPAVDCVIGIGSRLEVPGWRWEPRPEVPVIRLEIDPEELPRIPDALAVHGRARTSLRALLSMPELRLPAKRDWADRIEKARLTTADEIRSVTPHHDFLAAIRAVLPEDGIFVDEVCQAGFASVFAFPVYAPRSFLSAGYQGTLGFGFPTALGAKVARPDVPVVSIAGDGGFMFAAQELATAAQYAIPLVTIVFDNGGYGNVRRDQLHRFEGRLIGCELRNPDFVRLAETFGVAASVAETPEALRGELARAFAADAPWLIKVPITGPEASPWPFIRAL